MKLYANEKLFSVHNKYSIFDENKTLLYKVQSKIISIGKKTSVFDKNNKEIIYAKQELFHLTSNYNIYIRGRFAFKIKQRFNLFNINFDISNGYSVEGNFFSLKFTIYDKNREPVAKISRKIISIGDKYQIEVLDEKDIEVILSIIVVISNIIDERQSSNNN